jgi:hypothetical protein
MDKHLLTMGLLIALGGSANLFFPRPVATMCQAFGRLLPFIPDGPCARNEAAYRVFGAIAIAIGIGLVIAALFV